MYGVFDGRIANDIAGPELRKDSAAKCGGGVLWIWPAIDRREPYPPKWLVMEGSFVFARSGGQQN